MIDTWTNQFCHESNRAPTPDVYLPGGKLHRHHLESQTHGTGEKVSQ